MSTQLMPTRPKPYRGGSGRGTQYLARRARMHLPLHPLVGALESRHQRLRGCPLQALANQPIVGVAPANAGRSVDVEDVEALARDLDHQARELVDRDHLL